MSRRWTTILLCALPCGLASAECPAGAAARADGICPQRPAATDPVLLQTKATAALQRMVGHADEEVLTDADAEAAATQDCSGPITWHGSKCVDVGGGQSYNGAPVGTWDCQSGNGNQQWLLPAAGGLGTIRWASNPGKCLDAKSGQIALWDCNSDQSQQFTAPTGSSGVFRSALGRCLDVPWGTMNNGARLQVWDCNSGSTPNPNQVFTSPCPAAATSQQPQPSTSQPSQSQPSPNLPVTTPQPQNGRKGSFLVFGDWGFDYATHYHGAGLSSDKCQRLVADRMAQEMNSLGDVKFVINVGDSFYPNGVKSKSDAHWDVVWRNIYSAQLRSVPWYSIYGNHDLISDPGTCSRDSVGVQLNSDLNNRNYFYMPNTSYYSEMPELNLEIVAVDQNYEWYKEICSLVPKTCSGICPQILKARNDEGFKLFKDRVQNSRAKNLLVVTHYPTDFCKYHEGCASFKDTLRQNAKGNLAFFTGHTHVTQPMRVRDPTTFSNQPNTWLAGGGGGWSTEGDQGFIVGQITADGTLTTYPVLINSAACK